MNVSFAKELGASRGLPTQITFERLWVRILSQPHLLRIFGGLGRTQFLILKNSLVTLTNLGGFQPFS